MINNRQRATVGIRATAVGPNFGAKGPAPPVGQETLSAGEADEEYPELATGFHDIHMNARTGLYGPPSAVGWMASNLAPVYLDDARVTLQGDPRPQVAKILQAGGRPASQGVQVVRLREAAGADGHPIGLDEVIDREKAITPVYLRILKEGNEPGESKGASTIAAGDITRGTEAVSPT